MIYKQHWILRADLRANPNWVYVFGDNEARWGLGGQAKEMRGEPNAFGIPTLTAPEVFWSEEFTKHQNKVLDDHFALLKQFPCIVWPADGIGTGIADLANRAPSTYAHLQKLIEGLAHPDRLAELAEAESILRKIHAGSSDGRWLDERGNECPDGEGTYTLYDEVENCDWIESVHQMTEPYK